MVEERAVGGVRRRQDRSAAEHQAGRVQAGEQPHGRGLDVALDPGELAGQIEAGCGSHGQVRGEHPRRADERVAVHRAVAQEHRPLEPGNGAQHPLLFRVGELGLEPHQVVAGALPVLGAQLHHRIGQLAGVRPGQPHRFHRPEAQGFRTAGAHHLDGQAALEVVRLLEIVQGHGSGRAEQGDEPLVLVPVHGAVEVVPRALVVPAGLAVDDVQVQAFSLDDGCDGVVKTEPAAGELLQCRGKRSGEQGSGGEDDRACTRVRQRGHLPAVHGDQRPGGDGVLEKGGEALPVHRQGRARGQAGGVRGAQDKRSQPPHLLLEQSRGRIHRV